MLTSKSFNRVATVILVILVCLVLFPIVLMTVASFTDETVLLRNGYTLLPKKFSLDAYYYIVRQGGVIFRAYGVTIFTT